MPDVSVLMPARDAARTVGVAVRSALRSRHIDLELVCVDHASTDETRAVLARFAARDARVRVLAAPAAVDVAGALCLGRAACASPFVARMDADDVMHPDRLAADVEWLRAHPQTAAVASCVKLLPRGRSSHGMQAYVAWQNAARTADDHAREIWIEQPVCQPATTFRATALDVVGGWRSGPFPEDYELFLRLVVHGHAIEKRAAVHHAWREHANTTRVSRDTLAQLKAAALVRRFHVDVRPVFIAGAGKEGGRIARALAGEGVQLAGFLDVAARRIGRTRHGVEVLPASALAGLRARPGAFVIGAVGTSGARGVVRAQLADAGFVEGTDAVVVA